MRPAPSQGTLRNPCSYSVIMNLLLGVGTICFAYISQCTPIADRLEYTCKYFECIRIRLTSGFGGLQHKTELHIGMPLTADLIPILAYLPLLMVYSTPVALFPVSHIGMQSPLFFLQFCTFTHHPDWNNTDA